MDQDDAFQVWTVLLHALLLVRDVKRSAERLESLERLAGLRGRLSGFELRQEAHS